MLQDSSTVDALNQTDLPRRFSEARISSFQIEADLVVTPRLFYVHGEALERFAQMTNWDYYEAVSRFQKVLDAAGEATVWALDMTALGLAVCLTKRHLVVAVKGSGELLAAWQCMAAVCPDDQLGALHHIAAAGFPEAIRTGKALQGIGANTGTSSCSFDFCRHACSTSRRETNAPLESSSPCRVPPLQLKAALKLRLH